MAKVRTDPEYWERVLAKLGLSMDAGLPPRSKRAKPIK